MMRGIIFLSMMITLFAGIGCQAQQLELVRSGISSYTIVIPEGAGPAENKAAALLQSHLLAATGVKLPVISEKNSKSEYAIFIGQCDITLESRIEKARDDGFSVVQRETRLFISANSGHTLYSAVAYFLEKYIGCRKYDAGPALIPQYDHILLPAGIRDIISPDFSFRQSYYPLSNDAGYLAWHGLHKFEDLWGLWGHSFFRLIPPSKYYTSHPEYFALVGGKRQTTQLCLSNKDVLRLIISELKSLMAENPDAIYWSVSPNDEGGYCTCDDCRRIDTEEGSPSGSLIRFVNKVSEVFPDKYITTLGYGYTAKAPLKVRPADNVYILVSSIDAYKEQPVSTAPSAAKFREQLAAWSALTGNIFVWDYSVQFTNYLVPFPIQHIFQPDFEFYKKQKVKGIFEQGSGDTYGDMAELNSYLQAKLFWNTSADIKALTSDFCNSYYGNAGPFVLQYLEARTKALLDSKRRLDIYGSPMTDIRGYLSPENINIYDQFLEKAQTIVEGTIFEDRVRRIRLSLDYTVLQQSRHFGIEKYGFLEDNGGTSYSVKPNWKGKVEAFTTFARQSSIIELSESGLSPDAYQAEWNVLLGKNWPSNPIRGAALSLKYEYAEDFPAKGLSTLTDGMTGFSDFSYNWLCFYGQDMVATIDAGREISIGSVKMNFLEDQRHWIFPPVSILIEISSDGKTFREFKRVDLTPLSEKTIIDIVAINASGVRQKGRYIRVSAFCPKTLPDWRTHPVKKPMIACDEIFVFP